MVLGMGDHAIGNSSGPTENVLPQRGLEAVTLEGLGLRSLRPPGFCKSGPDDMTQQPYFKGSKGQ